MLRARDLKLKQPVLVALFTARRLGEVTAPEKAEAIRTAHAQRKKLKAMGGKGGFAEFANWVITPPGNDSVWGAPPGPAHFPHNASGIQWRRSLRQRIHGRSLRWRGRARQRRPGALRSHKRVVPLGPRGAGRPRRPRGRQRPRSRGLPEVYPRGFDFHEPPVYDLPIERML